MLQGLSAGEAAAKRGRCRPTRGFNFMSLNVPACQLDFLESKAPVLPSNTRYPRSESRRGFWGGGRGSLAREPLEDQPAVALSCETFKCGASSCLSSGFKELFLPLGGQSPPPPSPHLSYLHYSCLLLDISLCEAPASTAKIALKSVLGPPR